MRFEDLVAEKNDALTPSDLKLVSVLLTDPTIGSFMPAQKVAARAGVHPSTASRLARKLGFDTYSAMREALEFEQDASARVRKRVESAAGRSLLESVVAGEMMALSRLMAQVSQDQITAATHALRRADRIIVIGESHAGSLAELFARRLKRSGYLATGLSHADWQAADELISLTQKDLVFGMIFRHDSPGVIRALALAAERGANTILLTDRSVAAGAKTTITARRGEPGEFQSLTVPMAICNTLVLELSKVDRGRSMDALSQLETLRLSFENPGVPRKRGT
ncbi:MurR/RpiR family transcriptional regulator [Bordetella sp. LUAb4]|uniref:MurR/RpiR family transcriptional regulator n=1 Tax=Bordetella sp. LUAb4 TaxID=2843195 RepID=UPI001E29D77D|nr:MurR/RpiR family transcriptional regulator [Bordetella sp. LUAb4]